MTSVTLLTSILVPLGLYMGFLFFKDFWPMWMEHRRTMKQGNPYEAKKHPKSEIRYMTEDEKKDKNELLDYLLMPNELPNLEDRIVFDEHEKAIS